MLLLAPFILLLLSAALLAGDSWRDKTPDQWDEDEINQVLTDSPWARKAKLETSEGLPGPLPTGGTRRGAPTVGPREAPRNGGPGRPPKPVEAWLHPVIRWQGAEAVRSAYAKAGAKAPGSESIRDYYVIAAVGLPVPGESTGGASGENQEDTQQTLKRNTRLHLGKEQSLSPDRVEIVDPDGDFTVLFFFARTEVSPKDKLTFISQLGPLIVKAEFNPKDMQFGGALDL